MYIIILKLVYTHLRFTNVSSINKIHTKINNEVFNPNNLSDGSNTHITINNINPNLKSLCKITNPFSVYLFSI